MNHKLIKEQIKVFEHRSAYTGDVYYSYKVGTAGYQNLDGAIGKIWPEFYNLSVSPRKDIPNSERQECYHAVWLLLHGNRVDPVEEAYNRLCLIPRNDHKAIKKFLKGLMS